MTKKVSVIITVYDEQSHDRAISSVITQTHDEIELIIVNDNPDREISTSDIGHNEIKLVSNHTNRGGSGARNVGIMNATGEYIAFLDADDEWLPNKLEKQLNELSNLNEKWVGCYTGYYLNDNSIFGKKQKVCQIEGDEQVIDSILTRQFQSGGASSLLVESEAVRTIGGFNPHFDRHQDWEFLIRLAKVGKVSAIEEPLFIKNGFSDISAKDSLESKKKLFKTFETDIESSDEDIIDEHMLIISKRYISEGEFIKGFNILPKNQLTQPKTYMLLGIGSLKYLYYEMTGEGK